MSIKHPIILEGKPFDWASGGLALLDAVDEQGNINWRSAFAADPGVMICLGCGLYLWHEGESVECPDCGNVFRVV